MNEPAELASVRFAVVRLWIAWVIWRLRRWLYIDRERLRELRSPP